MRKSTISLLTALAAVISFSSCSVEKRVHRRGYHVEWNTSKEKVQNSIAIEQEEKVLEAAPISANTTESSLTTIQPTTQSTPASTSVSTSDNSELLLDATAAINDREHVVTSPSTRTFEVKAQEISSTVSQTQATVDTKQSQSSAEATEGGSKSRITALVLCFFLGALGIHRFYLGYTGIGVLYLLTLGLFGFGVLVDFIRLIIKPGLQPKDGSYEGE